MLVSITFSGLLPDSKLPGVIVPSSAEEAMDLFCKEISLKLQNERNFRVKATITFSFFLSFLLFFLCIFVHGRLKTFLNSDDFYSYTFSYSSSSSTPPLPPLSYLSCNSSSSSVSVPKEEGQVWHSMSDEELMWRASMAHRLKENPTNQTAKVAFMFLTRGRLPLSPLWEMFFEGYQGFYSIYVHTSPEYTKDPPPTSVFYKRRIPSKVVEWGRSSVLDAERRLLANALLDFSNKRFVLLSETCIPLFNFTTLYSYLINSNQSFVSSFDDPRRVGRGRYNKQMWPTVSLKDWRKGSQWLEVDRKIAIEIVSDTLYYPIFRDLCNPPCYMDEHYVPTLVTKVSPEKNSNRSITWVDWRPRGGPHPTMFVNKDVSEELLRRVRNGFNCSYNGGVTNLCFLFARKFHPNTLQPLLKLAPRILGFGTS